ncbi:lasso RiPP family leader peptide-containing protein [Actinomadura sp. 7K534]|nr:lasso RiPP family leader peptide-containing protein [Actinomadura sp. 7K534]
MIDSTRSEETGTGRPDRPVDRHPGQAAHGYEPPAVLDVGSIRDLVKGSSPSGKSDANSQYYW